MTFRSLIVAALVAAPLMTAHAEPHKMADIVAHGGRMTKLVEFEYMRLRIYSKDREELAEIARLWKANPESKIIVEGHAYAYDEEFTISLGEKRAQLVRSLLIRYGVAPDHVTSIDASRDGEVGRYVDIVVEH